MNLVHVGRRLAAKCFHLLPAVLKQTFPERSDIWCELCSKFRLVNDHPSSDNPFPWEQGSAIRYAEMSVAEAGFRGILRLYSEFRRLTWPVK